MNSRSAAKMVALVFISILVTGCAGGRYGRTVIDDQARQIFESYQIMPDHRYYYIGPDAWPYAVIAIQSAFTLKSDLWKPVEPSVRQMRGWFNWPSPKAGYDSRPCGRTILSDDGRVIGLWYSVRHWTDHPVVRMLDARTVSIIAPIFKGSDDHRWAGLFNRADAN